MVSAVEETPPNEVNYFLLANEETNRRLLMSGPWPTIVIVVMYLIVATKGPKLMKNRKPYDLRFLMIIYNVYQVVVNAFIFVAPFTIGGAMAYTWRHGCHPVDPAKNHFWSLFRWYEWLFFISRNVDLLDTVFFVLTKKLTHITFLHVFHHAEAVLISFFFTKYLQGEQMSSSLKYDTIWVLSFSWAINLVRPCLHKFATFNYEMAQKAQKAFTTIGEQAMVFILLNSFVHVVMYGYFMIAAMGPQYRKYLWWKSHVTKLQLFMILEVHGLGLIIADCSVSHSVSLFICVQCAIFLWLFGRFYWQTYIIRYRREEQTGLTDDISATPSSEKVKVG